MNDPLFSPQQSSPPFTAQENWAHVFEKPCDFIKDSSNSERLIFFILVQTKKALRVSKQEYISQHHFYPLWRCRKEPWFKEEKNLDPQREQSLDFPSKKRTLRPALIFSRAIFARSASFLEHILWGEHFTICDRKRRSHSQGPPKKTERQKRRKSRIPCPPMRAFPVRPNRPRLSQRGTARTGRTPGEPEINLSASKKKSVGPDSFPFYFFSRDNVSFTLS